MATLTQKSSTTTMVPATCGISIIIDQDQEQVVYDQKNLQKQDKLLYNQEQQQQSAIKIIQKNIQKAKLNIHHQQQQQALKHLQQHEEVLKEPLNERAEEEASSAAVVIQMSPKIQHKQISKQISSHTPLIPPTRMEKASSAISVPITNNQNNNNNNKQNSSKNEEKGFEKTSIDIKYNHNDLTVNKLNNGYHHNDSVDHGFDHNDKGNFNLMLNNSQCGDFCKEKPTQVILQHLQIDNKEGELHKQLALAGKTTINTSTLTTTRTTMQSSAIKSNGAFLNGNNILDDYQEDDYDAVNNDGVDNEIALGHTTIIKCFKETKTKRENGSSEDIHIRFDGGIEESMRLDDNKTKATTTSHGENGQFNNLSLGEEESLQKQNHLKIHQTVTNGLSEKGENNDGQLSPKDEEEEVCTTAPTTTTKLVRKLKGEQQQQQQEWSENGNDEDGGKELISLKTNVDGVSATLVNDGRQDSTNNLTVKIKINQNTETNNNNNNNSKQVTVVKVNESSEKPNIQKSDEISSKSFQEKQVKPQDLSLNLKIENMVQKPVMVSSPKTPANTINSQNNSSTNNCGSSVTDLNVDNSPYHLYYMMSSSGQFSPCETLDSGTGSDLESNLTSPNNNTNNNNTIVNAPKLEMNLKTTKIRVNSSSTKRNGKDQVKSNGIANTNSYIEHMRACSLTDSEESESSSSLSCDSLHSSEFNRQSSVSPIGNQNSSKTLQQINKSLGSLLPDSLLRDIRDRKFNASDFDTNYNHRNQSSNHQSLESVNENDNDSDDNDNENENTTNINDKKNHQKNIDNVKEKSIVSFSPALTYRNDKRSSLPNKTFILDKQNGSFVDTKLISMPRKYEADQFYNFHVNEHANFRSFGNNTSNLNAKGGQDDIDTNGENNSSIYREDDFAGFRDIRCGSTTSTIRSSKGTVRGVKNRVRNGIATFLQLQQPNIKNFKEKDNGKVVLYTTSMGIIRDTYAKCANVKQILRTLLIKFEERDVFMSIEYQQEIKERMNSNVIRVPQLFVEGQYIGDAETVERLNESGELRQLLKPYKTIASAYTCQTCGGYRLLPCPSCNGSKKSVHRNHFTAEFVALKCMNCDEVGLVKCHNC